MKTYQDNATAHDLTLSGEDDETLAGAVKQNPAAFDELCVIFAGLSAAEVGQLMGKNEAAVKMLVHRAVHDLQARLAVMEKEA